MRSVVYGCSSVSQIAAFSPSTQGLAILNQPRHKGSIPSSVAFSTKWRSWAQPLPALVAWYIFLNDVALFSMSFTPVAVVGAFDGRWPGKLNADGAAATGAMVVSRLTT